MSYDIISRHAGRISRADFIDAPAVETVNQQVRTSMSVPFQRHMLGDMLAAGHIEAPTVETINQQVRTSMSVPFSTYMRGQTTGEAPTVDTVNQQVRTSMSVPFSTYMRGSRTGEPPAVDTVHQQVRTSMSVPFNPYMMGAHAEELLKKRIMISPVLVVWQYKVTSNEAFAGWLGTREILMSEGRMSGDAEIRGVRYGGTYRVGADRAGAGGTYKTVWGYTSESAMHAMQRLCSDSSVSATIVQLELIDFVKGMKGFIAAAGQAHFAEEILISTAAG